MFRKTLILREQIVYRELNLSRLFCEKFFCKLMFQRTEF